MPPFLPISVIVPVYNAGQYLQETLDSICGQTLADLEIICVDDGSTDLTSGIKELPPGNNGKATPSTRRAKRLHASSKYA